MDVFVNSYLLPKSACGSSDPSGTPRSIAKASSPRSSTVWFPLHQAIVSTSADLLSHTVPTQETFLKIFVAWRIKRQLRLSETQLINDRLKSPFGPSPITVSWKDTRFLRLTTEGSVALLKQQSENAPSKGDSVVSLAQEVSCNWGPPKLHQEWSS